MNCVYKTMYVDIELFSISRGKHLPACTWNGRMRKIKFLVARLPHWGGTWVWSRVYVVLGSYK